MNKLQLYYRKLLKRVPQPDKWVFIVGCYNSGTTLLHDVISKHPLVGSMEFEGQYMTDQLLIKHNGMERLWAIHPEVFYLDDKSPKTPDAKKIKQHWGVHLNFPKRPVLVEKSPTNAARMLWLQKEFPNAHFIAIVRNGYAVAEGIRRKVKHDIALCAKQWAVSNEIMLRDFEKLNHKLLVKYEDFTAAPLEQTKRITDFLNISPLSEQVLNAEFKIRGDQSAIRNMNERSFAALSDDDRSAIRNEGAALLDRFHYTENA
jgi:hypothetical protein